MSFDLIGASVSPDPPRRAASLGAVAVSIGGGLLGLCLWRRHPVLGLLGGAALAGNAHGLATGERTWKEAARNLATHAAAGTASLHLPSHPALGWIGGAVAADLLLPGGAGLWDRLSPAARPAPEQIEVRPVEGSRALLPTRERTS